MVTGAHAALADTPALETCGVVKRFGGVVAVDGLSLAIGRGEIRGLIGPNGSGKTTTINTLSGLHRLDAGEIRLAGGRVDRLRPHEIAARGVARTFQIPKLFGNMTVLENVLLPGQAERARANARPMAEIVESARRHLDLVAMERHRHALAKHPKRIVSPITSFTALRAAFLASPQSVSLLAGAAGIELATSGFGDQRSAN